MSWAWCVASSLAFRVPPSLRDLFPTSSQAIFHKRFLDAYFVSSWYKLVLKKSIDLKDLESVDQSLHTSLLWMLENDITDIIYNTFSTEEEHFGEQIAIDLIPGGSEIEVTEENKKEYVEALVQYRIAKRIAPQMEAFLAGFYELVPEALVNVFDERELEMLIGGLAEIDVADWRKHTDYRGYNPTDEGELSPLRAFFLFPFHI